MLAPPRYKDRKNKEERAPLLALIAGLAFAVHPVVSEAVCWAKGLDDLMAGVSTLAAFRALLLSEQRSSQRGWMHVWFLLAVYSKVSALPFCVLASVVESARHKKSLKQNVVRTAGLYAIAVLFLLHRHMVIG